jgi:hypothetical protein
MGRVEGADRTANARPAESAGRDVPRTAEPASRPSAVGGGADRLSGVSGTSAPLAAPVVRGGKVPMVGSGY